MRRWVCALVQECMNKAGGGGSDGLMRVEGELSGDLVGSAMG